jgi:hypothetical protein
MDDAGVDALREAIKNIHGCDSRWQKSVPVRETYWTGEVQVFRLIKHASAKRCFAWSYLAGSDRRFHAVLEGPTVDSAASAVRAAIASRERTVLF